MNKVITQLRTIEELETVMQKSHEKPIVLFKHSVTCPVSANAFDEFHSYFKNAPEDIEHYVITVQAARPVSNKAAEKLNVRHESPQVILLKDGAAVWNDSHSYITEVALHRATEEHFVAVPELIRD
ncbi:MAG TPA: bacillithiol system redox-active protein YtxJ [Patescibacteria group bacterium]|nr:bacillithiol system redox-active protein YtxJ [Patescibacteria group bacterium]